MVFSSYRSIVLAAVAVSMPFSTANARASYLNNIPNGNLFSEELGHPNKDSSQYTDFATDFLAANLEWTTDFCQSTFPSSSMTNGQAFGDPCCTWSEGGTPDFTVTAFTTSPTEATTCASSTTDSSSTTTSAPSTATTTPIAATTEIPSTTSVASSTPSETKNSSTESLTTSNDGAKNRGEHKSSHWFSFRH